MTPVVTLAGSIIASALCINGWSIENCITSFETLSRFAFTPRTLSQLPMAGIAGLSRAWQLGLSLLYDGKYEPKNLEGALKQVFGSTRSLIDWSAATEMGITVGVPMTTVDGKTLVATTRSKEYPDTIDKGIN